MQMVGDLNQLISIINLGKKMDKYKRTYIWLSFDSLYEPRGKN